MFKLLKYELIGRYKAYLVACIIILLFNIYFFYKNTTAIGTNYVVLIIISFFLIFAAGITALITGIGLCKRDIYGDTGYLMFSLPIKGYAIVGYKLLCSFIELIIFSFIPVVLAVCYYTQLNSVIKSQVSSALNERLSVYIYIIIGLIITFAFILLLAHFSIAISKTAIANKKFGKLVSVVIFFVSLWTLGKISELLAKVFPYSIDTNMLINNGNVKFQQGAENVATMIFNFIICIILFIATSYIIEKKLDS
jgi:ABC-2 type transport system permease protein